MSKPVALGFKSLMLHLRQNQNVGAKALEKCFPATSALPTTAKIITTCEPPSS
jgi:hypothetical protein